MESILMGLNLHLRVNISDVSAIFGSWIWQQSMRMSKKVHFVSNYKVDTYKIWGLNVPIVMPKHISLFT